MRTNKAISRKMSIFKNIICILSSTAITITSVLSLCPEKISADEPEETYNIILSIDTVEVDINDIPENREIELGVYIENNPGFLGLSFILEKDSRLNRIEHFMLDRTNKVLGITFHEFVNNSNVTGIILSPSHIDGLCYDNGILITVKVFLPENVSIGDFYSVNFLDYYEDEQTSQSPALAREESFDMWRVNKDFKEFRNGGIRITGQIPEEPQPTEPEIIATQPPQPVIQNEPEIKPNEETPVSETTPQVSETIVTTVTTSLTLTTTSVSETSVTTTTSSTVTDKVTTSEITSITTSVQSAETSEYSSDENKPKEKTSVLPIAVLMGVIAIGTGVFAGIIRKNKEKNNEDK